MLFTGLVGVNVAKEKTGFTRQRHEELGPEIKRIRQFLMDLHIAAAKVYPKKSKQVRAAASAVRAIGKLRSEMDNALNAENRHADDLWPIYYRGEEK